MKVWRTLHEENLYSYHDQRVQLMRHARVLMFLRLECSVNRACVTVSCLHGVPRMPFVFSQVQYCDMHFVYGFCKGNARAAVEEY